MHRSIRHAALSIGAACSFSCGSEAARGPAAIRFHMSPGDAAFGAVDVTPYSAAGRVAPRSPEDWHSVLSVHVGDTTALAMLGRYAIVGDTLRFTPRYAPSPGTRYVARSGGATEEWRYERPAGPATTVVSAVYPTTDTVPMNLLKMYVEFSAPMSTGRAWEYIKVYAEPDSLLSEPFFTGGDAIELWDPEKTRLTVLFDPGRIKRDLKPHEQRGLPLREGKRYRLVIDSAWPDAQGLPLVRAHVKRFRVGPQDRTLVNHNDWRVVPPRADTRDSLLVGFPEPLDRALLARMLVVREANGAVVPGDVRIAPGERRWSFTPRGTWGQGRYDLEVDTELEDLAGNNLRRLFDVAPGDSASRGASGTKVRLGFVPRGK